MAIELKNISKSFGGVHALSDVSLTFGGGKIYGLQDYFISLMNEEDVK